MTRGWGGVSRGRAVGDPGRPDSHAPRQPGSVAAGFARQPWIMLRARPTLAVRSRHSNSSAPSGGTVPAGSPDTCDCTVHTQYITESGPADSARKGTDYQSFLSAVSRSKPGPVYDSYSSSLGNRAHSCLTFRARKVTDCLAGGVAVVARCCLGSSLGPSRFAPLRFDPELGLVRPVPAPLSQLLVTLRNRPV